MKHKLLIIKLGYSETLDKEISRVSSFGDVLRTTVILHLFKDDYVTWLTDEGAVPLLYNNPYINRILTYDFTTAFQVQNEMFDVVVNFEKVPGICAMSDNIKAWKRYGFRFHPISGMADSYMFSEMAMEIVNDDMKKQTQCKFWQERLFEMFGAAWNAEEYLLGYQPKSVEKYDIGFNYHIGTKWPTKAWNIEYWKRLQALCEKSGLSVSWQKGLENLYEYMDWLHSCRMVVTNDSLGLHIAIALKKKTIGLFGPTNEKEVPFYGRGIALTPSDDLTCRPCNKPICLYADQCINRITPETVFNTIQSINGNSYCA